MEERRGYFAGLQVGQAGDEYMREMGQYPVIYLSFVDLKCRTWEEFSRAFADMMSQTLMWHCYLGEGEQLNSLQLKKARQLLEGCTVADGYARALRVWSELLYAYHGKPVVLLIDEYDLPFEAAFNYGYYDRMTDFMRTFLGAGLKDNGCLKMAVLTGILRVAKESIFSGLNNLRVDTILDDEFSDCFGFTEEEVETIAAYYGYAEQMPALRRWYDGYHFGSKDIYNPWSVNCCLASKASTRPYWVNTSGNALIADLCTRLSQEASGKMIALLNGSSVTSTLDCNVVYADLNSAQNSDVLFSFLEAGLGRADIMLIPRSLPGRRSRIPGVVMELKRAENPAFLHKEAQRVREQIEEKKYTAGFPQDTEQVWKYGIAFCGKEVDLAGG